MPLFKEGDSFETGIKAYCADLGVPEELFVDYAKLVLWSARRTAVGYFSPSSFLNGPDEETAERIRKVATGMKGCSKGKKSLELHGGTLPLPVMVSKDDLTNPVLSLKAEDPTLEGERLRVLDQLNQAITRFRFETENQPRR